MANANKDRLIQFEMTTLEEARFVLCDARKCAFRAPFTNESTTSCNQVGNAKTWLKTCNNKFTQ
jgi:hypothetical protein